MCELTTTGVVPGSPNSRPTGRRRSPDEIHTYTDDDSSRLRLFRFNEYPAQLATREIQEIVRPLQQRSAPVIERFGDDHSGGERQNGQLIRGPWQGQPDRECQRLFGVLPDVATTSAPGRLVPGDDSHRLRLQAMSNLVLRGSNRIEFDEFVFSLHNGPARHPERQQRP